MLSTTLCIAILYFFTLLAIAWFFIVYRFLNHAEFRSDSGDVTTEVGYTRDQHGRMVEPVRADLSDLEVRLERDGVFWHQL